MMAKRTKALVVCFVNSLAAATSGASGPETEGVATPAPDLDGAVEVAVEVAGSVTARAVVVEEKR